jgi:hypothetical protein
MTRSADRTSFVGTAYLHGGGGNQRPFSYRASYSKPQRDHQGCVRFGWTATVAGVDMQPQPRTTIVHAQDSNTSPEFVERRIQRSIEEHLAAFLCEAAVKLP